LQGEGTEKASSFVLTPSPFVSDREGKDVSIVVDTLSLREREGVRVKNSYGG